jgi:hypothetical protein
MDIVTCIAARARPFVIGTVFADQHIGMDASSKRDDHAQSQHRFDDNAARRRR